MRQPHVQVGVMPEIISQSHLELVMDVLYLSSSAVFVETWIEEEITKSIKRLVKSIDLHVEMKVCRCHRCVGIP